MRKIARRVLAPLAAAGLTVAMTATGASAADAQYQATLNPLNDSGGSGMATVTVVGNEATVSLEWSGLEQDFKGKPYPHVQHVHIGQQGECPTPAADDNGDGVVDTVEGRPSYGKIAITLSTSGSTAPSAGTNLKIAPTGSSTDYFRTIQLTQEQMDALASGQATIVVHGLAGPDVTTDIDSKLVPKLPLAATAPALCGELVAMPTGGVATGGGSTIGVEHPVLFGAGTGLLAVAAVAGVIATRRRLGQQED